MKVLNNKETTLRGPSGKFLDYKKLIIDCLDNPQISPSTGQSMGFSRSMLNDRNRIEKVVNDSDLQMIFEDNDATNLKNIVFAMRWGSRHEDFTTFTEAVEEMKNYEIPKKVKEEEGEDKGENDPDNQSSKDDNESSGG